MILPLTKAEIGLAELEDQNLENHIFHFYLEECRELLG